MTYFFPAGAGGTLVPDIVTNSSKLFGRWWLWTIQPIYAWFNCFKSAPPSVPAETVIGAAGGMNIDLFAAAGIEAGLVSAAGGAAGVSSAGGFLPQPAKNKTPTTSAR